MLACLCGLAWLYRLGFLLSSTHLLSLTAAFLVIAVAALGYRARERRGYGPLTLGLAASVAVLDIHKHEVASRAKQYGVRSVPAVVIDGTLATCCAGRGVKEGTIREALELRG